MLKATFSKFGTDFPQAVRYVSELHFIRREGRCLVVAQTYASQEAFAAGAAALDTDDYAIDLAAYLAKLALGQDAFQALDELFRDTHFPGAEIV